MAIVSAATGLIGANKTAKATRRAAEDQIEFANAVLDLGEQEGIRAQKFANTQLDAAYRARVANTNQGEARGLAEMDRGLAGFENALNPYAKDGRAAADAVQFELGLGERPEGYQGVRGSEAYKFRLKEQQDAVQASAAARGGLFSGATMNALAERSGQMASQEYDNNFNRLNSVANRGYDASARIGSTRLGVANNRANIRMNASAQRGEFANALRAGRIGASQDRANLTLGQAGTSSAMVGNALQQRANGQIAASQQRLGGINQGLNNTIGLGSFFGAF